MTLLLLIPFAEFWTNRSWILIVFLESVPCTFRLLNIKFSSLISNTFKNLWAYGEYIQEKHLALKRIGEELGYDEKRRTSNLKKNGLKMRESCWNDIFLSLWFGKFYNILWTSSEWYTQALMFELWSCCFLNIIFLPSIVCFSEHLGFLIYHLQNMLGIFSFAVSIRMSSLSWESEWVPFSLECKKVWGSPDFLRRKLLIFFAWKRVLTAIKNEKENVNIFVLSPSSNKDRKKSPDRVLIFHFNFPWTCWKKIFEKWT